MNPVQSDPPKHSFIFCYKEPLSDVDKLKKEITVRNEAIAKRDLSSALDSMKRLVQEYNTNIGQ